MARDSIPSAISRSTAARTASSSRGGASPVLGSVRAGTSRRRLRGTKGLGFSQWMSYSLCIRMRRISSTSRKPFVVISPVTAPVRVMIALVAIVAPWV